MDVKELMRELADRIQKTANVRAVFGEPVGEGSNAIIPVARVTVSGGGGGGINAGTNREGRGRGMGLGMNIVASPVGYIRQTPDGAVFIPVIDKNRLAMIGMGVAVLALWVLKVGLKMIRR
jgi:uncharacterized spore protein YtfJ